jgi:hypothetical protein
VAAQFKFLTTDEFERLSSAEKLAYISKAMAELERGKVPRDARGWHSLFRDETQPGDDTEPPESR